MRRNSLFFFSLTIKPIINQCFSSASRRCNSRDITGHSALFASAMAPTFSESRVAAVDSWISSVKWLSLSLLSKFLLVMGSGVRPMISNYFVLNRDNFADTSLASSPSSCWAHISSQMETICFKQILQVEKRADEILRCVGMQSIASVLSFLFDVHLRYQNYQNLHLPYYHNQPIVALNCTCTVQSLESGFSLRSIWSSLIKTEKKVFYVPILCVITNAVSS